MSGKQLNVQGMKTLDKQSLGVISSFLQVFHPERVDPTMANIEKAIRLIPQAKKPSEALDTIMDTALKKKRHDVVAFLANKYKNKWELSDLLVDTPGYGGTKKLPLPMLERIVELTRRDKYPPEEIFEKFMNLATTNEEIQSALELDVNNPLLISALPTLVRSLRANNSMNTENLLFYVRNNVPRADRPKISSFPVDLMQNLNDPRFLGWVMENRRKRIEGFTQHDLNAMNNLLNLYAK